MAKAPKTFGETHFSFHSVSHDATTTAQPMEAKEAHKKVDVFVKHQESVDVSVSFDGTWQKQGHTSNPGLEVIIDVLSGLVFDFEVLLKYRHNCVVTGRDIGVEIAQFRIWQNDIKISMKVIDNRHMPAALIMWRW
ncbi:hypothetical protein TNCV_4502951 [Trichonephila clavipes]|nr:hypothetical protein TNCV_4502951 [Trichonephila clavipes]